MRSNSTERFRGEGFDEWRLRLENGGRESLGRWVVREHPEWVDDNLYSLRNGEVIEIGGIKFVRNGISGMEWESPMPKFVRLDDPGYDPTDSFPTGSRFYGVDDLFELWRLDLGESESRLLRGGELS